MYRRLIIVSVILFFALCGLCVLGFHSISLHRDGLVGKRSAEFMEVAEQVRIDIKRKLDKFIQAEQERPYTDYQYYYVPEASIDLNAIVRSPLAGSLNRSFAYGYFQIEPDGSIVTPYYLPGQDEDTDSKIKDYIQSLEKNLLAVLNGSKRAVTSMGVERISSTREDTEEGLGFVSTYTKPSGELAVMSDSVSKKIELEQQPEKVLAEPKAKLGKAMAYKVDSLQESQQSLVERRSRTNVGLNLDNTMQDARSPRMSRNGRVRDSARRPDRQVIDPMIMEMQMSARRAGRQEREKRLPRETQAKSFVDLRQMNEQVFETASPQSQQIGRTDPNDTVQIWKEPFVTLVIPDANESKVFAGDVFLLRHVQIEQNHFLQGFKLDGPELVKQVKESAQRFMRRGMGFDVSKRQHRNAMHTAILDFDFGKLVLNLIELEPRWISRQISVLKNWYFAIITIVFLAVILALTGLWRSAQAQLKLARKKDDFISAVSHELRTPLTSIRMYTEMLEKDWVKTDVKRNEYYNTMRQESERLSRLIENVLDFSRIQRGRKKYVFKLGNINDCVGEVVDMMAPYARQAGFALCKEFKKTAQVMFDHDAIMQIVINLIDNAVKYASNADDKIIFVRTGRDSEYILIEVEDHGPGVPHLQRKKIFDEFYRIGDESVRETAGTGLGLALVKKFAQAHEGFVEVLGAKPKGAIFRVYLPVKA
jgi:signal transduction histidine kinase